MEKNILSKKYITGVFFVFAFGYFLSTLLRAITATLSPVLTDEFSLNASNLGLLAGGYFFGFAAMQIPLGFMLDRFGPKKIVTTLFNFILFVGIFIVQWMIGLIIDFVSDKGYSIVVAYQVAFSIFLGLCLISYIYFVKSNIKKINEI